MGEVLHSWGGFSRSWTAILSREPYGLHFSVGGKGRAPTDREVDQAFADYKLGLWIEEHMTEVTSWWADNGQVNPCVRHFVPDDEARRIGVL